MNSIFVNGCQKIGGAELLDNVVGEIVFVQTIYSARSNLLISVSYKRMTVYITEPPSLLWTSLVPSPSAQILSVTA